MDMFAYFFGDGGWVFSYLLSNLREIFVTVQSPLYLDPVCKCQMFPFPFHSVPPAFCKLDFSSALFPILQLFFPLRIFLLLFRTFLFHLTSDLLNRAITFEDLKEQRFCIYDDVYHELLFDRLQYMCGPLNLILKTDDHWAIAEAVTKLGAVCIGRSQQAILSLESKAGDYVTIDIGHLINDNTTLGWLMNPRVEQPQLVHDLIDDITAEIKKSISSKPSND